MATFTYTNTFSVAGVGTNGATVNAYKASRFSGPPALNASPPGGGADATATTGTAAGSNGAFAIPLPTAEDYYIAVVYSGTTYWQGPVSQVFADGATAGSIGPLLAPTKPANDSSQAVATTAFVQQAIAAALATIPLPSAPTLVSAVPTSGQVVLTWTAPANSGSTVIGSYTVLRGTSSGTETSLATGISSGATTYTDATATNATTWYYKVEALNSVGTGPMSNELSATPTASPTAPGAPTLVSAVAGSSQVVLTWTAPASNGGSAITSYVAWRGTTTGGETSLHTGISSGATTYTDSTAVNGTTYFYEMKAVNAIGTSVASNEISATPAASGAMSPPAGYSSGAMIFDDQFHGTSLNTSNWNTYLGANGGVWNDWGSLSPYSGANDTTHGGSGFDYAIYTAAQVTVNNGLTLTAVRGNTTGVNPQGQYTWMSGCICSQGKWQLPSGGWYVQVRAKMPDTSTGMWPAIWLMPDTGSSATVELDIHEGGSTESSWAVNNTGHSNYFANSGTQATVWNAGVDLSAGYHVYGCEFKPGVSVKFYFDGTLVFQALASNGVTITSGTYELILQLEVASAATTGWHTVTTGSTASPLSMLVSEVQAYHV